MTRHTLIAVLLLLSFVVLLACGGVETEQPPTLKTTTGEGETIVNGNEPPQIDNEITDVDEIEPAFSASIPEDFRTYFETTPTLKLSELRLNLVGQLAPFVVFRVIDENSVLIHDPGDRSRKNIVLMKVSNGSTVGMVGGRPYVYGGVFEVTGTKTFTAARGATRTVDVISEVPDTTIAQFRKLLGQEAVDAERYAREKEERDSGITERGR